MNPLFRIDFSISDSLKIVRKSVLIYETIIIDRFSAHFQPFKNILDTKKTLENAGFSRVFLISLIVDKLSLG